MAENFPEMPSELRRFFPAIFWNWWQSFRTYLTAGFFTNSNIIITKASAGVILTSANGRRWRLYVDNAGALHTTLLP